MLIASAVLALLLPFKNHNLRDFLQNFVPSLIKKSFRSLFLKDYNRVLFNALSEKLFFAKTGRYIATLFRNFSQN